jgi:hypothetical protein
MSTDRMVPDYNDLILDAPQKRQRWVTPKISLMDASCASGSKAYGKPEDSPATSNGNDMGYVLGTS